MCKRTTFFNNKTMCKVVEEWLPQVDAAGKVIGKVSRKECHNGSFILHPVVHLHLFNSAGELYLQKRSEKKDIQPGKWDTAVGGHVDYGENIAAALQRETAEELGIEVTDVSLLTAYVFCSEIETELVHVHKSVFDGLIYPNEKEISEGRFWSINELESMLDSGIFTPNFVQEYRRFRELIVEGCSSSMRKKDIHLSIL